MKILFQKKLPIGEFITYDECPQQSVCVKQTHSSIVLPYQGQDISQEEADAIVVEKSALKSAWPTVKTADCLPVCLLGPNHVAMVHAGWRGVAGKILLHPEIIKIKPFYAFIGPSIHAESFEVTSEFYQNFTGSKNFNEKDGRITFDLQQEVTDQLKKQYPQIEVVDSGLCTYQTSELYSYRRDKGPSRNWNIFKL